MDNLSVNQNYSLCAEYKEWCTILIAAATSTLMAFQSLRQNVPSTRKERLCYGSLWRALSVTVKVLWSNEAVHVTVTRKQRAYVS